MKRSHGCTALVVCTCVLMFISSPNAQDNLSPARIGVPQDWSQNQILFTRDGLMKNPGVVDSEPRVVFQAFQRWQTAGRPQEATQASSAPGDPPHRDWNVSLNNGHVAANMFPAKYSFDAAAPPSCANDYVVFGLSRAGANKQANLVAFNNLYSGTPAGICGAAPTTLFAYNISTIAAGRILTSPVLSLDGTQIAFVESGNIAGTLTSVFHVLTWSSGPGNGTAPNQPAVPGVGNTATMTSLTLTTPATAALDNHSSPWVDYKTHTAYVGTDDGHIYKIVNVFNGTPALAGGPWPLLISSGDFATSPVLDNRLGKLLVSSQNGTLYKIDVSTGAITSLVIGKRGTILAPALVDVVNGTAYVVSANDGTSGVLVQVNTNAMSQITKGRIGLASRSGTAVSLSQPAVSNTYFTNPASAVIRTCGTGPNDITPYQYAFGFTGTTMNSNPVSSSQLLTSTNARCTGFTEFFNPNIGAGGTDFFFFGLTQDCAGAGTSGCVVALNPGVSLTEAAVAGGPSGIVVDNYSTAAQASSIYFSGVGTNTAFKLTQNGLQ